MFRDAHVFNQDISNWCVKRLSSKPDYFALDCPLQAEYYPVWGTCPFAVNINDIDNAGSLSIYPNPATGVLTIEFDNEQITGSTIELLDISGKVVYATTINPGETQHQINLISFEEGLYLIRISNTDYSITKKVIIID